MSASTNSPALFGICLVKDEADIVEFALQQNSRFFDKIFVYDNGSSDGSWQIVQRLAERNPVIIPFRQRENIYNEALRAEVFEQYRNQANPSDWWCRLDSDEIYPTDPRPFLAAVPKHEHVVYAAACQFYLVAGNCKKDGADAKIDKINGWADLPSYYLCDHQEPRFFRYRDGLCWQSGAWPRHLGLIHRQLIPLLHFPHRSPAQLRHRIAARRIDYQQGCSDFIHALADDWRSFIRQKDELKILEPDSAAGLHLDILPDPREPFIIRFAKKIMHGLKIWP